MWICTQHGYYSTVADKDDPTDDTVWVRARSYDDLVALRDLGYDIGTINGMRKADYPYRVRMHRSEWSRYVATEIESIAYPNFKNRVKDRDKTRSHVYMDVWYAMTAIENEDPHRIRVARNNEAERARSAALEVRA